MSEIANFESWVFDQMLSIEAVQYCVSTRVFNSFAPPKTPFPYSIFNIIPLEDNFGQARTSIQTRLFLDFQIYRNLPGNLNLVDLAVAEVKEYFRENGGAVAGDTNISIRHQKPIARTLPGKTADEKIIVRGSTYKVWLSRI